MPIKLNALAPVLVRAWFARVNTFIVGKPAIGKTETIEAFVAGMKTRMADKSKDFGYWKFYVPAMSPMDIQATAPDYETKTLRFFNNAGLPNAYDTPDAQGILFLGELPNADAATTKLLQKYINGEDMSGVLRKPAGVVIIADGNGVEHKSGVQQQGRAFMSRFQQVTAYSDADDNLKHAGKHDWHPLVQAFLKENVALIDNYDEVFNPAARSGNAGAQLSEEARMGVWANMRSWNAVHRLECAADELGSSVTMAEVEGNVGSAVAAQYEVYKKTLSRLVGFDEIVKNPAAATLPTKPDEVYMLAMMAGLRATVDTLPAIVTFCGRMALEMQVVVMKTIIGRKGVSYSESPEFMKWITSAQMTEVLRAQM